MYQPHLFVTKTVNVLQAFLNDYFPNLCLKWNES